MKFFRKVGEFLGLIEENKTAEIIEERDGIKGTLVKNLRAIDFTDDEISEVLAIITKAEEDVQIQKDMLIGTNINNPNPNPIMREKFAEIRRIQLQSGEDIKAKIAEIRARKGM